MVRTSTPLALIAAGAAFLASEAFAGGIQDDIESCGTVAIETGLINDEGTTLRFVSDKGNRNRVLTLKAVQGRNDAKVIECRMKRAQVIEVVEGQE